MSGARILCVDDEPHILQVVSLKLRNAGYEVITAGDGEEAFEIASATPPDLVITDFQMPYLTGLELCRQLASNESTRNIPVIILTARGYALDESDLVVGNIREVVSKPFSPRAILDLVERALVQPKDGHDEAQGTRDWAPIPNPRSPMPDHGSVHADGSHAVSEEPGAGRRDDDDRLRSSSEAA